MSAMHVPGIYSIRHAESGKQYIGSAVNLHNRMQMHRNALRRGDHHSVLLQRAWNKHGPDGFEFRVLVFCASEDLLMYEQRCIDGFNPEYNICKTAGSRLGTKYSEEAKIRLSAARKAAPRSPKQLEHLAALADRARGKPGRRLSQEVRAKISASLMGYKQSQELIEKRISKIRGRTQSEASRAAISAGIKGKKRAPFSQEWRAKISAGLKGRKLSEESIAKMIATRSERHRARKAIGWLF